MKFFSCIKNVMAVALTILCLSSCSGKTGAESFQSSKKPTPVKDAKPGAAIKLISTSIVYLNPNQQKAIEILLGVGELSGTLEIELTPTNGLHLVDTQLHQTIQFTSSAPIKFPVNLMASANGRYYLNMHIRLNRDDSMSVRNLALIVQVGSEADKAVQFKKTTGENVISLPAQETISTQ